MNQSIVQLLDSTSVIPVIEITDLTNALPLAQTFYDSGIKTLEIVLRTPVAIDAIRLISNNTNCLVGAGSVLTRSDAHLAKEAGAQFIVSPGFTPKLITDCESMAIPILPGVSTASEMMELSERGLSLFKFFPASSSGGIDALKAISGPLPHLSFCPTGGVNKSNFLDYLALTNVKCVGGSWLAPSHTIIAKQWEQIRNNITETLALLDQIQL